MMTPTAIESGLERPAGISELGATCLYCLDGIEEGDDTVTVGGETLHRACAHDHECFSRISPATQEEEDRFIYGIDNHTEEAA